MNKNRAIITITISGGLDKCESLKNEVSRLCIINDLFISVKKQTTCFDENGMMFLLVKTAHFFGTTIEKLRSTSRLNNSKNPIVTARQFFSKYCYDMYIIDKKVTYRQVGLALGGRDHSTIISSKNALNDLIDIYPNYRDKYAMYVDFLNSSS